MTTRRNVVVTMRSDEAACFDGVSWEKKERALSSNSLPLSRDTALRSIFYILRTRRGLTDSWLREVELSL